MQRIVLSLSLVFLLAGCLLLTGCSKPSDKELIEILNSSQGHHNLCVDISTSHSFEQQDKNGEKWLYVDNYDSVEALRTLGMVETGEEQRVTINKGTFVEKAMYIAVRLTQKGQAIYDKNCKNGFYFGRRIVKTIESFTPPANDSRGIKVMHVRYIIGDAFENGMDAQTYYTHLDHLTPPPDNQTKGALLRFENRGWVFEQDEN